MISILSMAKKAVGQRSSPEEASFCQKAVRYNRRIWPDISLQNGRFVVFDTETTGLHCHKGDEIISLGAIVIEDGRLTGEKFSQLINPCREIPALATEITGITDDMVAEAPEFFTVLEAFLEFSQTSFFVAHNGAFDLAFINQKLKTQCGCKFRPALLDTYILSHLLSPMRRSHSLDALAPAYEIDLEGRHSALGDSLITGQLFLKMVANLLTKGIHSTGHLFEYLQFRRLL